MIRALSILAAVAALAVTPAPASAGSLKKPSPRTTQVVVLIGANEYGLMETDGDKLFYVDETGILRQGLVEEVPWPLCGADEPQRLFEKEGFTFVQCGACDFTYVYPQLREDAVRDFLRGKAKVPRRGASFGDTPGLGGGDML